MLTKSILFLVLFILMCSCLDRIDGIIGEYENLLVVDGLITDECIPYEINLTRTTSERFEEAEAVSAAEVEVEDDEGNIETFNEIEPGRYVSNPDFLGQYNRKYRLHIETDEGEKYMSDWCELRSPGELDSVYVDTEVYTSDWWGTEENGIAICIDGKGVDGRDNYYRWTFEEDWKFHTLYTSYYIVHQDNTPEKLINENYICWKSHNNHNIILHSTKTLSSNIISKKRIQTIHAADNDRVSMRYSIKVKQMSISEQEYLFWKELSQWDEDNWDLFGRQPYSITGNVHNVNDPNENVLGYFQVSGVLSKRIYIDANEAAKLNVRNYNVAAVKDCRIDSAYVDTNNKIYLYTIYTNQVLSSGNAFEGLQTIPADSENPLGLTWGYKSCVDCTATGNKNPPEYWEEE